MENVAGRDFHAAADLFPLLRGAAFDERILDGRNRYRACLEAGLEPQFTNWKGEEPRCRIWRSASTAGAAPRRVAARDGGGAAREDAASQRPARGAQAAIWAIAHQLARL